MERRRRVVPGEVCMWALKRINTAQGNEAVLNVQKSAEAIVAGRQRAESTRSPENDWERRRTEWMQKTETAARKRIVRNTKDM